MPGSPDDWARTWIGGSTPDRITVAGRDLPGEIMGRRTLTELTYLLVTRRDPTGPECRMLDAVLVSLADHGLTPSALAARLTYTGAPEAIQGAIAAGLLGAGSVFLGPTGDTAEFLVAALQARGAGPRAGAAGVTGDKRSGEAHADATGYADTDDATLREIASEAVDARRAAKLRVPGLGHPVHKETDPRTPRLYELAAAEGLLGPHLQLLRLVAEVHEERTGKHLPINGAGAGGAALVDIGIPPVAVRGVVLIARTAGLIAHLVEEAGRPLGMPLWLEVERRSGED